MKKLKYHILFVILFMTIGIAAVTTNIVLSGSTSLVSNSDDFDVYFDYVTQNFGGVSNPGTILVIDNEKSFSFDVSLDKIDETLMLDIYITNASKNYDADVSYTCNYDSEYILVSSSIESSDSAIIEARSRKLATLDIKLIKSYAGDGEIKVPVTCTLIATPVERNSKVEDDVFDPVQGRYSVGAEIAVGDEKFNVISDNGDTISMLAKYNLGTDYRQNSTANSVVFSTSSGWEYTPGPKEIDIQEWSTNPKLYINEYIELLKKETNDLSLSGDLISLKQLSDLGCIVPTDYSWVGMSWGDYYCPYTSSTSWIGSSYYFWTKSAFSSSSDTVWAMDNNSSLYAVSFTSTLGVRPVITISKAALEGKLITFTIEGVSYNAIDGMTWGEWVDSSYNTAGLVLSDTYIVYEQDYKVYDYTNGLVITSNNYIYSGISYYFTNGYMTQ